MLNPCGDPAAGSGGFLIRAFEHVRSRITAAVQAEKDQVRAEIEAKGLDPEEEETQIDTAFAALLWRDRKQGASRKTSAEEGP